MINCGQLLRRFLALIHQIPIGCVLLGEMSSKSRIFANLTHFEGDFGSFRAYDLLSTLKIQIPAFPQPSCIPTKHRQSTGKDTEDHSDPIVVRVPVDVKNEEQNSERKAQKRDNEQLRAMKQLTYSASHWLESRMMAPSQ
jgi:hypothetical protein